MNALKNRNRWLKGLLLFSCLLPFASREPVFAQCTATDSEYQVNTYFQGSQDSSSVAGLTGGEFLVTWKGSVQDGSYNAVYGQRFSFRNKLVLNFGPAHGLWYYDQAGGWKQCNTVNPSQMVTVDLNDDGTDELVAAFPGDGLHSYDATDGWRQLNTEIPEDLIRYGDGIVCDFGAAYGLWLWSESGAWKQINDVDPDKMIAADIDGDGDDELIVSFTGYGLYFYDAPGVWTQMNAVVPENMIQLNNGIGCDFGAAHGLWIWTQAGGWEQWNPADPDKVLAVDINHDGKDELVVSFAGYGLYRRNETGFWTPMNTVIPENMVRLNNGIGCDFGAAHGLWTWTQGGGWQERNTVDPGQMTVVDIDKDGAEELVASFPGYGLYYLDEADGWQLLNAVVPEDIKSINFYPSTSYVPCTTDDDCKRNQSCDRTECLSCCPNSSLACIDLCCGKCTEPMRNDQCKTDADCTYGAEWCEDGACVACDNSGVFCDLYCEKGMIDPRNGCQPCMCRPAYVPCLSDEACEDGQVCDRSECLSCCPGSTGVCIEACCGKCVDDLDGFCGWSTNGPCTTDADCMTGGCSGQVCQSISEEPMITTCEWAECYSAKAYGVSCGCVNGTCQWK